MTQVDFYILSTGASGIFPFSCKLLAKACSRGHQIHVRCENTRDAVTLDNLLWTFDERRFVPHKLARDREIDSAPVIFYAADVDDLPADASDILMNLSAASTADMLSQFTRVIEIVPQEEPWRSVQRHKYSQYQQLEQCTLHCHKV